MKEMDESKITPEDFLRGCETPSNEPIVLKVAGANSKQDTVARLSLAIMLSLQEHGVAILRCIGPPSIANKDKAFIKAREMLQSWTIGYDLAMTCCYKKVDIDGNILTAEEARVFAIPSSLIK